MILLVMANEGRISSSLESFPVKWERDVRLGILFVRTEGGFGGK